MNSIVTHRQRSNMKLSKYSTTFGCADVRIIAICTRVCTCVHASTTTRACARVEGPRHAFTAWVRVEDAREWRGYAAMPERARRAMCVLRAVLPPLAHGVPTETNSRATTCAAEREAVRGK